MGPAACLKHAYENYDPSKIGLPNVAVYGWVDEITREEKEQLIAEGKQPRGKWHIVKVEAYIPGNCKGACNLAQSSDLAYGGDPAWPRVKTKTKSWGFKRCYYLTNERGIVKFRTTRFDEETVSNLLTFPGGAPIWQFRSAHPARQEKNFSVKNVLGSLNGACTSSQFKTFADGTPATYLSGLGIYDGAFIMNEMIFAPGRPEDNTECWNRAHSLMTLGVVDETCAEYNWMSDRMNFKFVDCKPF